MAADCAAYKLSVIRLETRLVHHGTRIIMNRGSASWTKIVAAMEIDVSLRDVQEGDFSIFYEQQLDPEATHMAAFPARDYEAFTAHWEKGMAEETTILKTVVFQGRVAGNVVSWEQSGKCNVGYWLGKEYWGKGVASAALSLFLTEFEKRPLFSHVAKHNVASIHVLQKCGFANYCAGKFTDVDGDEGEEFIMMLA